MIEATGSSPEDISRMLFTAFQEVVQDLGMAMEKKDDGELVVYTGWTYDDEQEKYREMTDEELTR